MMVERPQKPETTQDLQEIASRGTTNPPDTI
jgi:hypothetical protein